MTERNNEHDRISDAPIPSNWSSIGPSAGTEQERVPDERIREDVCDRLMQFGPVDCTEIDVSVNGGVVLVEGELATEAAANRLLDVARSVAGVRDVHTRITLRNA